MEGGTRLLVARSAKQDVHPDRNTLALLSVSLESGLNTDVHPQLLPEEVKNELYTD